MAPSTLYADERTPPDDATRLRMFLDTVDAYEQLQETYPLPTSYNLHGVPRSDYWTLVLHAGLLRKFFAPTDQATVAKVIESVSRLVLIEEKGLMQDLQDIPRYAHSRTVPVKVGLNVGGHDVTLWEVVEVELYGRHLHTDYGKWVASQKIRHGSWNVHLGQWCGAAAMIVTHTAARIRWWSENGFIDFDAPAQPGH